MVLNQQPEIMQRLRSAAGHLNSVIKMAESGEPCEHVLHQLNAVRSALSVAGTKIICCEAKSIREDILNSLSFPQCSAELHRLQSLYTIYIQRFNQPQEDNYD
jgi:DNA-binding FrmR family transcriptional regulator